MPFRFNCEQCDVRIKVPDGSQGKKVRCPGCGQSQQVPGQRVAAAAPVVKNVSKARQPVAATGATPPKETNKPQRQVKREVAPPVIEEQEENVEQEEVEENATDLQTTSMEDSDAVTVTDVTQEESLEADRAMVQETARDLDALHAFLSGGSEAAGQASADDGEGEANGDDDEASEIVQALKAEASDADVAVAGDQDEDSPQAIGAGGGVPTAAESNASDETADMQPAPSQVDSESGEAPAGEVRDLFDDYVKREELERIAAEEAKAKQAAAEKAAARAQTQRQSRANKTAQAAPSQPVRGEPVVVAKAPVRINRATQANPPSTTPSGVAHTSEQASGAVKPVEVATVAPAAPVVRQDDPSVTQALAAVAQAAQSPRAAQAIPLSGSHAQAASQRTVNVVAPAAAQEMHDTPQVEPPVARVRKSTGLMPAYTLLLVLCWSLRVLSCLSLVSVVKLLLIWSDNGATTMDLLITLPLGIGLCAGIWAIGEVARVTRDAARANHH